jgi:hypothetical protein
MKYRCSKCGYTGDGPDFPHPKPIDGSDCRYVATTDRLVITSNPASPAASLPVEWMDSLQWAQRLPKTGGCAMSAKTVLAVESQLSALRDQVARLERERDAAFAMSRCECAPDECCANLVASKAAPLDVERAMELADEWVVGAIHAALAANTGHISLADPDAAREALRLHLTKELPRRSPDRASIMAGWQPMDSAPKDGRSIWVIDVGSLKPEAGPAHWSGSSWHAGTAADWNGESDAAEKWGYWPTPTHWMHLPPPPALKAMTQEEA